MVTSLGRSVLSFIRYLGELALLAQDTAVSVVVARLRVRLFMWQMFEVGWRSQLVVIVTGMFTGAVLTAQTYFQFSKLGMKSAVGSVVAIALFRELGPVLTGLMVAGRVGASFAAEIGTMKVTEQIDALRSLGVHPTDYLVVPRVLALLCSMPLLVAESIGLAIIASYFVGTQLLDISAPYFISNLLRYTGPRDIKMALVKGFCFAVIIAFVSCHQGLTAKEGAVGVGRAPTEAVVLCSLAILVINFFLTFALNLMFPYGN
ncbi:MAG: phospholipid/cholesterol/gamma-HCH transport system permease protein [Chthoniobacter sp.]|jgi:phospholipid/cholesterol/gamma-HCH transport system permease protein|nr:phospholipid/cholesterol/gamma-HCH transport system permease protein [Chthoniobacter sp.]